MGLAKKTTILRALGRWVEGRTVYVSARDISPEILPITSEAMDRAKELADADASISARDAVHAAVVSIYGLEGILTFDPDFDRIPGRTRIVR